MNDTCIKNCLPVRVGIIFALVTILYGFGLGGVFGAFEHNIKDHLSNEAQQVLSTKYAGDEAKMKKITSKSWVYFKRAHLHANGIGTTSLVVILLISMFPINPLIKTLNALALGIGALGYSSFWMFAALRAPGMGSTGAAKESLAWLAIPSSWLCILGLLSAFVLTIYILFLKCKKG